MIKNHLCTLLLSLWAGLGFSYPMPHAFPPFKIADHLYYVGTDDLASYLVVTPKGNILINSSLDATVPMVKKSIEQLGFKYSDTKILLISHAHLDHAQGSQRIQEETHAQYRVMAEDITLVESGGKTDFQYGNDASMHFPATHVDRVLHDGDKVTLGGVTLVAHLTPGHTPGCTTWSMVVKDHGHAYQVVILGSLSVNPGYQLVDNKKYPMIAEDYQHAFKTLKSMRCDIFLGAHASYFDLHKKYALLNKQLVNPFVDPKGCKAHIALKEDEFKKIYHKQSQMTK